MKSRPTLLAGAAVAFAAYATTGAVADLVATESGDGYDVSGTIAAYEGSYTDPPVSGVQCAKYTIQINPENARVAAGVFTPASLDEIGATLSSTDGYADEAAFLKDAKAKGVAGSLCGPDDFVDGVCSSEITTLVSSKEYVFAMMSNFENATEVVGRFESCDEDAVEGTETVTEKIAADEGFSSEPFDGVTCVKYTFSTTPGAEITAGVISEATMASVEASLGESATLQQYIDAVTDGAVKDSVCLPADFTDDGECSKYVPTLDANTAYTVAAGNAGDADSDVTVKFALCPNTVDVETQTTVEIAGDITADDEQKTAIAMAKAMLGDDYSADTKITTVKKYQVNGQLEFASTVSVGDATSAIATKMGVEEQYVDVTVTATGRRRLLAGSKVDYTIKTTSRTVANAARSTAATATDITINGAAGVPNAAAAKVAATVIVTVEVPKEKATKVAETVAAADFEAAVTTAVATETGNAAITVQADSTKTNTDIAAAVEDLNTELGIVTPTPSGADRRAGVLASVILGFVATALLQ